VISTTLFGVSTYHVFANPAVFKASGDFPQMARR
jgi:hypothetical protein